MKKIVFLLILLLYCLYNPFLCFSGKGSSPMDDEVKNPYIIIGALNENNR